MTKSELAARVARAHPDLTKKNADLIVATIFESMTDALVTGDKIELRGFGSFQVKDRAGRVGRNPRSGASVEVPPKRVIGFRTSKLLRGRLNPNLKS